MEDVCVFPEHMLRRACSPLGWLEKVALSFKPMRYHTDLGPPITTVCYKMWRGKLYILRLLQTETSPRVEE